MIFGIAIGHIFRKDTRALLLECSQNVSPTSQSVNKVPLNNFFQVCMLSCQREHAS